jgi:hypothetical protein
MCLLVRNVFMFSAVNWTVGDFLSYFEGSATPEPSIIRGYGESVGCTARPIVSWWVATGHTVTAKPDVV